MLLEREVANIVVVGCNNTSKKYSVIRIWHNQNRINSPGALLSGVVKLNAVKRKEELNDEHYTNNFSHELIVDVLGMGIETIAEICNVNNYKDCNFYH